MSKTSTAVKDRWNKAHYSVISVQLPKELVAEFKNKCRETGVSQAQIIKKSVEDFLKKERRRLDEN